MYSQSKEQGVINSLFGDTGRFLDVGAFDGKTFSNTLKLYERGWSGVLFEPSELAFAGLQRQYDGKSRVFLVKKAVTTEGGLVKFYDSGGDAISSTSMNHKIRWENGYKCKFTETMAESITFGQLFNEYGTDFDFVNIDVEGENLELLRTFPFDVCHPMCMCLEYDGHKAEMERMLAPHEYRTLYTSAENIVVYRGPK